MFGAISRQMRRHTGRRLQFAVFYARVRPTFQAARHRWPGLRDVTASKLEYMRTTSGCSTGRHLRPRSVSLRWRVVREHPLQWRCWHPSRRAYMCMPGSDYQCRRKWKFRPLTSHTAAPNARGLSRRHVD